MKKTIYLLLSMVLLISLGSTAYAAEDSTIEPLDNETTEAPSLEEQILSLENEIIQLEQAIIDDSLTSEELEAMQLNLEDAKLLLASLYEELHSESIAGLLEELTEIAAHIEALKARALTELTPDDRLALEAKLLELEIEYAEKKTYYDEITAPTYEELIGSIALTIEELNGEIADIQNQLASGELSEEQINDLTALLLEKQASLLSAETELQALIEEKEAAALAETNAQIAEIKEQMVLIEEALLNPLLSDEEKAALEAELLALEEALAVLEEETTAIEQGENNPNLERFANAELYGITPGKMNLLERLNIISGEADIDYSIWSEKSVQEIMQAIKDYRKQEEVNEVSEPTSDDTNTVSPGNSGNSNNGNSNSGKKKEEKTNNGNNGNNSNNNGNKQKDKKH